MMPLRRNDKVLLRDLFLSLVNRTSVKMLEHVRAEQKEKVKLLINNPEFGAWRIQQTDDALISLEKILGFKPTTKAKRKKKNPPKGNDHENFTKVDE